MRNITYICTFLLFICTVNAQPIQTVPESPTDLFNKFQEFSSDRANADSAFYCAKKLASDKRYILLWRDLLHDSFAQQFVLSDKADSADAHRAKDRRILGLRILSKMVDDTTNALSESVHPLFLLTKIQANRENPAILKTLTDEFIKTEIEGKDIYKNRSARYGLMISEIIGYQSELKLLNDKLRRLIAIDLESNQIKAEDAPTRIQQDKRAWYRYLYAYVNYVESERTADVEKKKVYLKTAFDFSPDLIDRSHQSAYFYDMILILGKKRNSSFRDEYLDFITKHSQDRTQVLSSLLNTALIDTDYKEELKIYYDGGSPSQSFDMYWSEAINLGAPSAFPIVLDDIDKLSFSSKKHKGKWILIDFWGTWCGPCREEHPDMEKFYESTVVKNPDRIALMTIACNDKLEKVLAYMKEKSFSFPVAMSDQRIEKTYAVQGYPTKILITPIGKYIPVPFGVDWVSFVKKYSGLE